jgi:hypothetical protein
MSVCIVVIVALLVIDQATLESIITKYIVPQLVFFIGLMVLAFLYWRSCGVGIGYALVPYHLVLSLQDYRIWQPMGEPSLGCSSGVAFLVVYGIGRIWFDYSESRHLWRQVSLWPTPYLRFLPKQWSFPQCWFCQ